MRGGRAGPGRGVAGRALAEGGRDGGEGVGMAASAKSFLADAGYGEQELDANSALMELDKGEAGRARGRRRPGGRGWGCPPCAAAVRAVGARSLPAAALWGAVPSRPSVPSGWELCFVPLYRERGVEEGPGFEGA